MKSKIKKVAVLGSGVMGAQIAGHLANAGISSFLFDLKKSDVENSKESLKKLKRNHQKKFILQPKLFRL